MDHVAAWQLHLYLSEHDDRTKARVVLDTGPTTLQAEGEARRNPHDTNVPEIGDEIATGRALGKLSAQLLRAAESDVAALAEHR